MGYKADVLVQKPLVGVLLEVNMNVGQKISGDAFIYLGLLLIELRAHQKVSYMAWRARGEPVRNL